MVLSIVTLFGGLVDALVFDGPGALFGVVFLLACFFAAARVRSSDLMAAPVSAPIAFALTLALTAPASGEGLSGQVLGVATGLAMQAGWLYAGTLIAAGLSLLRYFTLRSRRSAT